MPDRDPVSDLHQRLAELESTLTYARQGKSPPQPVDLLSWRADLPDRNGDGAEGERSRSTLQGVVRSLREDWHGLSEAVRTWAIRFEARLGR